MIMSFLFVCTVVLSASPAAKISFAQYHKPEDVASLLQSYVSSYPQLARLMSIGKSYGKHDLSVLQIAGRPKGSVDPDKRPSVLVSANLEGIHHVGTETALMVIDKLLNKYGSDKAVTALLDTKTVYVAPLLNPDAAANFFAPVCYERSSNAGPVDDDLDDRADEDGPDDLNKDGLITQMRVKDPEGKWVPDPKEPRLMRPADPKKGEKGIYAIYTEGLDNDGDGDYNEDPRGGVSPNRNFPHDFEHNVLQAGLHPVSEEETKALGKFLLSRPQIALILNFSTENTILNMQQTGVARPAAEKIKITAMYASFLGVEPDSEFTAKEIAYMVKGSPLTGGMEITEEMVLQFFGGGPAMAIDRGDLPVLEAVQKEYKDALKSAKIDYPEKNARGVGKGSFVAYCYYQFGVPVFSVDLWGVPEPQKPQEAEALTADRLKSMTTEQFLALGEDKLNAFLKEQGAPPNLNAAMIMNMVKSGQLNTARMAEMMEKMPRRPQTDGEEHPDAYILKWADTALKGKGFVSWTTFKHPTLGEVEIGGFVPYLKLNPPPDDIEKTASFHADFYINLMNRLAGIEIGKTEVKALGEDIYQVTAYFTNPGRFPTSTAQGRKAGTSWPIRISLNLESGQSLFSGRPMESIPFLAGSGETKKLEWIIRGKKGSRFMLKAASPKLGSAEKTVVLE